MLDRTKKAFRRLLELAGSRAHAPAPAAQADDVLFRFGPDELTLAHLREGVLTTGAVGAGKTSTVLTELPLAVLQRHADPARDAGCLWLTSKPDEVDRALAIARAADRLNDVILVGPGHDARADLLAAEVAQCGDADVAAQLLDTLMDIAARARGQGGERFWQDAAQQLIRTGMLCLILAGEVCSLRNLYRLLTSTAARLDATGRPAWPPDSYCLVCLMKAMRGEETLERLIVGEYLTRTYPAMADRMQSSISTMALTTVTRLLTGPVAPLVSAGEPNVSPLDVLNGLIVVMAYPVQVGRESARLAQLAWKLGVTRAALRRPITPDLRDVLVVADECQNFMIPDADAMAAAVARQSRLVTLNAFQNLPLLYGALGGGDKARQETHAWLACQRVKFVGSNDCEETNKYFSDLFGQHLAALHGGTAGDGGYDVAADFWGTARGGGASWNETWQPLVRPEQFTRLRTGGPRNRMEVDFFLFQGGRVFSTGETHRRVTIHQAGI